MGAGEEAGAALPAALFLRPEAFQRERRAIFENAWLLLARASSVESAGSYVAQTLGGWPVFAIADGAGVVRAFRNVCRHQGLPLFDTGTGHCAEIRCRFHGWTYDASGRLIGTPPKVAPPDPGDPLNHLQPVAAQISQGLLFVHLGEVPPPLATAIEPLAPARLDEAHCRAEVVTDIDANWKAVMEQALSMRPAEGAERVVQWPTVLCDIAEERVLLHQVIPRAFQRSRVHHHCYSCVADQSEADMIALAKAEGERLKAATMAAQAVLEQGRVDDPAPGPALLAFRARLRAVHAHAS